MKWKRINNQKEMETLAKELANLVNKGTVICLTGDLGAGKTTFTQAFAKGLGIQEPVTSPTFTILHEYEGSLPLYHFDVYRINDPIEMEDIGYEEYFFGDGVCVIEWASMIKGLLPKDYLWIDIKVVGLEERKVAIEGTNKYYESIIKELLG